MSELRDSNSILEIAFEGEVGFGLGPTLEFYTLVSHQLMTASLSLWHGHNYTDEGYIIAPAPGLYPRPLAKNLRSSQSREVSLGGRLVLCNLLLTDKALCCGFIRCVRNFSSWVN